MVRLASGTAFLAVSLAFAACSSSLATPAPDAGLDVDAASDAAADAAPETSVTPCTGPNPSANDLADGLGDGGFVEGSCDGPCDGVLNNLPIVDFTGAAATFSPNAPTHGAIPTTTSSFSKNFGTNGRTCFGCHAFDDGWTLSTDGVQQAFQANATVANNDALDPVFRPNDGANSPTADLSTPAARQAAYSMLLNRAVIRVGMSVPKGAEFTVSAVDDPYAYATAAELSLYRRPLPTQNLLFESDIMWDGRESIACGTIRAALDSQANNATLSHAASAQPLVSGDQASIVDFERTLFAAQISDFNAGALDGDGALGGPVKLAALPFYIGMNDSAGADPKGVAFTPMVFTLFDAWTSLPSNAPNAAARAAIVRGQALFNTRSFSVSNVRGLNDDLGQPTVKATCSTCHDTPNIGNSSLAHRYDIGVSDAAIRTADLPLYTLTRNDGSGQTVQTTDPGRALVSGKWQDVGRFKVPALRNLVARFPYFHNGSAARIVDTVKYHDTRFAIGLTQDETNDLVSFLQAL